MESGLIQIIHKLNPWLLSKSNVILENNAYIPRQQENLLLDAEWDPLWLVLVGPRQAGKTTLGRYLCQRWLQDGRFSELIYLNCDLIEIRNWLKHIYFIDELKNQFNLSSPIIFIDEAQRLENAGLLMKAIIDLNTGFKFIASGSSQLEIKSTIQEFLTGRHLEATVLPLSAHEIGTLASFEEQLLFGSYPQIIKSTQKQLLLQQLYNDYISKDIIEILKISKPDTLSQLLTLIAHSSGQLVNYQQLASDCRVTIPTIQHYLGILEKTYVIKSVRNFHGNKRQELSSNPIYYFIDNGFRNQSLNNFSPLSSRTDNGLLVESYVFQEIYKHKLQHFKNFDIHYWRTKGGAEVDFIIKKSISDIIPVEVKYRSMKKPTVSRGFRSFIEAYNPKRAFIINKNLRTKIMIQNTEVCFIGFDELNTVFQYL